MLIPGKKNTLARLLHRNGILHLLRGILPKNLVCYSYHRIRSDSPPAFCQDVFGPSQAEFYEQMTWVKKKSHAISEEELIYSIDHQKPLPPRSVLITFDDGYRDNYDLAFPVLQDLQIPATYFIPTQLIGDRKLGWWDLIPYYIKNSRRKSIELEGKHHTLPENIRLRLPFIRDLQNKVKSLKNDFTDEFLRQLSQACEVLPPPKDLQDSQLMTWDQIKEVSQGIVTIGSHTHTHRVLTTLNMDEQRQEFIHSKAILETQLNKPVRSIAFPVGGYEHFFSETQDLARDTGYRLAFTHLTGANPLHWVNPYNVRRISVPTQLSRFSCTLVLPGFFSESYSDQKLLRSVGDPK